MTLTLSEGPAAVRQVHERASSQPPRKAATRETLRPRGPRKTGRHPGRTFAVPPTRPPRARAFFHPVRTPTGVVVPRSRPARLAAKHGRGLPTPAPPCPVDAPHVRAATLAHPCRPDAPSARPGVEHESGCSERKRAALLRPPRAGAQAPGVGRWSFPTVSPVGFTAENHQQLRPFASGLFGTFVHVVRYLCARCSVPLCSNNPSLHRLSVRPLSMLSHELVRLE